MATGISIVYRWGGIETILKALLFVFSQWDFYCLPLRRYWDASALFRIVPSEAWNFYCLPLRRYWDEISFSLPTISRVFLLSTAEAVLRPEQEYDDIRHHHFYCLPLRRYWDNCTQRQSYLWRNFYCLPLRRYWDITEAPRRYEVFLPYFYCLPLRRYWDCSFCHNILSIYISIVYRWGGIETELCVRTPERIFLFLLSTAEAVLRQNFFIFLAFYGNGISIVYRWGGIETRWSYSSEYLTSMEFLLSTAEAVLRRSQRPMFLMISIVFLLSTAEAVLRPGTLHIKILSWCDFYCLPLRRYWDPSIFLFVKN